MDEALPGDADGEEDVVAESESGSGDGEPASEADGDGDDEGEGEGGEARQAKAPWHFKLIVVGSVVYLGYRLYQGITWLAHHV